MTTFLDGPAAGKSLSLGRAPKFLRVTKSGETFDALDQLDDRADPDETLFAYQTKGATGMCHVLRRPPGKGFQGSGFFQIAEYRFVEKQPGDAEMRDNSAWRKWCEAQP